MKFYKNGTILCFHLKTEFWGEKYLLSIPEVNLWLYEPSCACWPLYLSMIDKPWDLMGLNPRTSCYTWNETRWLWMTKKKCVNRSAGGCHEGNWHETTTIIWSMTQWNAADRMGCLICMQKSNLITDGSVKTLTLTDTTIIA